MNKDEKIIKLLLVDDEADFRLATAATLGRRGFTVVQAADGDEALSIIPKEHPEIVILDLKMPRMGGIETLKKLREIAPALPVIILTGHGDFDAAVAGIKLEVVDFLQKPVDINLLAVKVRALLEQEDKEPLREKTVAELIVSPSLYPRISSHETVASTVAALKKALYQPIQEGVAAGQSRSALVYNERNVFIGIVRFHDLLNHILPAYLSNSPYSSFFTGMFLAQCKILGNKNITELLEELITIDIGAPLMEAVSLMVSNNLINLPVTKDGQLIGILRERDIVLELAGSLGSL